MSRIFLLMALLVHASPVLASGKSTVIREVVETILRREGDELLQGARGALADRVETIIHQHGDAALDAVRLGGTPAVNALEAAGPDAGKLIRLFTRHGDRAAWLVQCPKRVELVLRYGDDAAHAILRHPRLGETLIAKLGRPGADALAGLNPQNARRLAMLVDDGKLPAEDLLTVIGRHGDRAMDFIWRNKGALMVTACLVAFVSDPEPFLEGARDLAEVVAGSVSAPLVEGSREAARQVNWTAVMVALLGGGCLLLGWKAWCRRR